MYPKEENEEAKVYPVGSIGASASREAKLTPKGGSLTMKLADQELLTNQLNERLEALFNKIQPVWQSPPQNPTDVDKEIPEYPPYVEQLARHNRRIRGAIDSINLMIDGLEV